MIYKGLVLYYSATGNTKYVADMFPKSIYDVINISDFNFDKLNDYKIIVLGMSTWGRGMPPKIFQKYVGKFVSVKNKTFFLFGSGRLEYEFFCGALDLYREVLSRDNNVGEIFKYEGFPTVNNIKKANEFISKINIKLGQVSING